MLGSLALLAFGASLLLPVSDRVPSFNVEPSCRAAAKMGESLDARLPQCLRDEQEARQKLEADWLSYTAGIRQECIASTNAGGEPSYVELLECMIMARDAKQIERSN